MNRRLNSIALTLTVGLTFFGCNSTTDSPTVNTVTETTETTADPENFKLIALGDSYTIGQSVCDDCRFPAQLKDSLQARYTALDTFNLEIIAHKIKDGYGLRGHDLQFCKLEANKFAAGNRYDSGEFICFASVGHP